MLHWHNGTFCSIQWPFTTTIRRRIKLLHWIKFFLTLVYGHFNATMIISSKSDVKFTCDTSFGLIELHVVATSIKILLSKLLNVQLVTLISLFKASAICIHWGQSVINESSKRKYSFICMFWKISEDSVKWASTWTISSSMFTKDYQSFLYQVDQFGWKVTLQMAMAANSAHYRLLIAYSAHCHTPTLPKKKY